MISGKLMVLTKRMFCITGLTVAEHFRDAEGQDVLLFVDNIFRFTQVRKHPLITVFSFKFHMLLHSYYPKNAEN